MGMTIGLLNSIKTHYDNKIFYYFKKRSQLKLNNKKSPNRGDFYSSDLIAARMSDNARARSSINPFRLALVKLAAY